GGGQGGLAFLGGPAGPRHDRLEMAAEPLERGAPLLDETEGLGAVELRREEDLDQVFVAGLRRRRRLAQPGQERGAAVRRQPPDLPGPGPGVGLLDGLDEVAGGQQLELRVELAIADAPEERDGALGRLADLVAGARMRGQETQDRSGGGGQLVGHRYLSGRVISARDIRTQEGRAPTVFPATEVDGCNDRSARDTSNGVPVVDP